MFYGKSLLILLYFISVTFFGIFLKCTFFLSDFFCIFCSDDNIPQTYDYIIVGSGSAGSIVANRLANNKNTNVLVLEAGRYDSDLLHIPSLALLLQKTPFDWNYETVPQENACLALNQNVSIWPMGKILGGTSMLNNMLYVRGHKEDFDEWFKDKQDYDYSDILDHFEKLENNILQPDKEISNKEKLIYVGDSMFTTSLPDVLLKAAEKLGYPTLNHNIESYIGFSRPKLNLYKGRRWTSAEKIKLNPSPSLHIKLNRVVEKVLFKSNYEAYGVKYNYLGKKYIALARKAVILSAGVIGTPKILMLSGIGRKEHLEKLRIKTLVDLPVGDNLQDHLTTGFGLILLNKSMELGIGKMLSISTILEYFLSGAGPWTTAGCELIAFLDTKNSSSNNKTRPDLQFMVMPLGITEDDGVYLRTLIGISDKVWLDYFSKIQQPTMTILPVLLHPKSKGTVRLASTDPLMKPIIDPRYLTDPEDIDILIRGIDIIRKLVNTEEMSLLGATFNTNPFPACNMHLFDTKDYWECYIRHLTTTSYHPVGTCKMGSSRDDSSVVDFNFQVKGTNKLYVVDGSVVPTLTSGNINAAIFMLAQMASDVLKITEHANWKRCTIHNLFIPKNFC